MRNRALAAALCAASVSLLCVFAVYAPVRAFTPAQADRGLQAYDRVCSKCHQPDLQGNQESEAPALVGETFDTHWRGQPIKELFDKVSSKMPADNPASLPAGAYLDIVAYLLQANKVPVGNEDLDLTQESLMRTIPAGQ